MAPTICNRAARRKALLMTETSPVGFEGLGLAAPVLEAVKTLGYESPSPIQARSIPVLLSGRDLLGQAQTGTGKTAAFALPLLSRIDPALKRPQLLVLAPTRELAIQVAEAFQAYARQIPDFHVLPIYGGQSMGDQLQRLKRGVQVVVGTPGRVMDHLRRGTLNLDDLQSVVLDEADEMLRMGFVDDVTWILEHTPPGRQVALFSATMPKAIRDITHRYLHDPETVTIEAKTATVSNIEQRYWTVSGTHKLDALTRILEVEPFDAMIIFVRTKSATEELAEKLEARGYATGALNGDMNQQQRERTVERIKNGGIDIIIATDVAARGLDVERMSHVLNYDIPYDTEAYVHRIGRTGRAGRSGKAILFVAPRETRMLRAIERATRQPLTPMELPSRQQLSEKRQHEFKAMVAQTVAEQDLDFFTEVVAQIELEHELSGEQVAAALVYLLQKEKPLQALPEPKQPPRQQREERGNFRERGERRGDRGPEEGKSRYRIEVGRDDGVEVREIVGAVANEAGIPGRAIGRIQLFGNFSIIELPDDLEAGVLRHLEKVRVRNRMLKIRPDTGPRGGGRGDFKKKEFKKGGYKKPGAGKEGFKGGKGREWKKRD